MSRKRKISEPPMMERVRAVRVANDGIGMLDQERRELEMISFMQIFHGKKISRKQAREMLA